jgi:hypothetical protein
MAVCEKATICGLVWTTDHDDMILRHINDCLSYSLSLRFGHFAVSIFGQKLDIPVSI